MRRVNRPLIDHWIHNHMPDGVAHLAVASKVSSDSIRKSRASGLAPRKLSTCYALSKALGVDIDVAFPDDGEAPRREA